MWLARVALAILGWLGFWWLFVHILSTPSSWRSFPDSGLLPCIPVPGFPVLNSQQCSITQWGPAIFQLRSFHGTQLVNKERCCLEFMCVLCTYRAACHDCSFECVTFKFRFSTSYRVHLMLSTLWIHLAKPVLLRLSRYYKQPDQGRIAQKEHENQGFRPPQILKNP